MAPQYKKECPPDIVRKIERLEVQSDKCYRGLALLQSPWNVAAWAALTESVRLVETSVPDRLYGSRHHINAATNASMFAAQVYKFALKHGHHQTLDFSILRWNSRIGRDARRAFEIVKAYVTFCNTFPYWHADKYAGELVNETTVRFVSDASLLGRRVNAYRQGIRPRGFEHEGGLTMDLTSTLRRLYRDSLASAVQISERGVHFVRIRQLQEELYAEHDARTLGMRRRYPQIRIGQYTLDDFMKFYSALNAVAGAHEYLVYLWSLDHGLPVDSVVLFEHRSVWVAILSHLAQLSIEQVYAMLRDVTFGRVRAVDFHLLPFVPLSLSRSVLALAPYCSLSSNWEENILGCFARADTDMYSMCSLSKEEEMRRPLIALNSGTRLITGGHKLPKGLPDIDLIVQDLDAKILIICELKWARKPAGQRQREERDRDVLKGTTQIGTIRKFVEAEPRYLFRRGYIAFDISEFRHVHYCVVARDHLVETPVGAAPIYSYDAFGSELKRSQNTLASLRCLEGWDWLPTEGDDFNVRFERHSVNGVAVESEVYYPAGAYLPF